MAKYTNRMDEDYIKFRALISQQKVVVDVDNEVWTMYDAGPKNITCPLLCLPPAIGTADAFFKQIIGLSTRGYRIITLSYPVYWTLDEFMKGLTRLIDQLGLIKVHLFGASLGGYLAQKFVEGTKHSNRVHSLFLCNSFHDTSVFRQSNLSGLYWTLPAFMLRRTLLQHLPADGLEVRVAEATDFMVERLDTLSRSELASRLTLNCSESYVEPQNLREVRVTIMDVFDESALTQGVKDDMYKCYPEARRAHLKTGGNFPYLSRSGEVNLYLEIHLRQFVGTPYTALDPARLSQCEAELFEELRRLEELEKQGKIETYTTALSGKNKSADSDRLTDSNGFQQVSVSAVIEEKSIEPKNLIESNQTPPTLDLSGSDFFASDPGDQVQSQTTNETENIQTDPIIEQDRIIEQDPIIKQDPVIEQYPIIEQDPIIKQDPIIEQDISRNCKAGDEEL